jgi:8-oxo-dGTP pyrophosphatase MutT (NUDIX family)
MKTTIIQRLTLAHKLEEEWVPGIRGYHQAVGCMLLARDTGRFNFQLRSPTSDTPNTYGSWGGSVDNNEELYNALRRELLEETGYDGPMEIMPLHVSRDKPGFEYYNHLVTVPYEFTPRINDESGGHIWTKPFEWPDNLHPGLAKMLERSDVQQTLTSALKKLNPM